MEMAISCEPVEDEYLESPPPTATSGSIECVLNNDDSGCLGISSVGSVENRPEPPDVLDSASKIASPADDAQLSEGSEFQPQCSSYLPRSEPREVVRNDVEDFTQSAITQNNCAMLEILSSVEETVSNVVTQVVGTINDPVTDIKADTSQKATTSTQSSTVADPVQMEVSCSFCHSSKPCSITQYKKMMFKRPAFLRKQSLWRNRCGNPKCRRYFGPTFKFVDGKLLPVEEDTNTTAGVSTVLDSSSSSTNGSCASHTNTTAGVSTVLDSSSSSTNGSCASENGSLEGSSNMTTEILEMSSTKNLETVNSLTPTKLGEGQQPTSGIPSAHQQNGSVKSPGSPSPNKNTSAKRPRLCRELKSLLATQGRNSVSETSPVLTKKNTISEPPPKKPKRGYAYVTEIVPETGGSYIGVSTDVIESIMMQQTETSNGDNGTDAPRAGSSTPTAKLKQPPRKPMISKRLLAETVDGETQTGDVEHLILDLVTEVSRNKFLDTSNKFAGHISRRLLLSKKLLESQTAEIRRLRERNIFLESVVRKSQEKVSDFQKSSTSEMRGMVDRVHVLKDEMKNYQSDVVADARKTVEVVQNERVYVDRKVSEMTLELSHTKSALDIKTRQLEYQTMMNDHYLRELAVHTKAMREARAERDESAKKLNDKLYIATNATCPRCKVAENVRNVLMDQLADKKADLIKALKARDEHFKKLKEQKRITEMLESTCRKSQFEANTWRLEFERVSKELNNLERLRDESSSGGHSTPHGTLGSQPSTPRSNAGGLTPHHHHTSRISTPVGSVPSDTRPNGIRIPEYKDSGSESSGMTRLSPDSATLSTLPPPPEPPGPFSNWLPKNKSAASHDAAKLSPSSNKVEKMRRHDDRRRTDSGERIPTGHLDQSRKQVDSHNAGIPTLRSMKPDTHAPPGSSTTTLSEASNSHQRRIGTDDDKKRETEQETGRSQQATMQPNANEPIREDRLVKPVQSASISTDDAADTKQLRKCAVTQDAPVSINHKEREGTSNSDSCVKQITSGKLAEAVKPSGACSRFEKISTSRQTPVVNKPRSKVLPSVSTKPWIGSLIHGGAPKPLIPAIAPEFSARSISPFNGPVMKAPPFNGPRAIDRNLVPSLIDMNTRQPRVTSSDSQEFNNTLAWHSRSTTANTLDDEPLPWHRNDSFEQAAASVAAPRQLNASWRDEAKNLTRAENKPGPIEISPSAPTGCPTGRQFFTDVPPSRHPAPSRPPSFFGQATHQWNGSAAAQTETSWTTEQGRSQPAARRSFWAP